LTKRPLLHPAAEVEYLDAIRHYEAIRRGLGAEFDRAAAGAVEDIDWNPEAWPPFPGWDRLPLVRSRNVDVFPYRVVYFVRGDEVILVAFAHQSREPGYWAQRIDS